MEINRKIAAEIMNKFEEMLNKHEIKITNEDRKDNENAACIYGNDYYELEDAITKILYNSTIEIKLKKWIEYIKQEKDVEKVIRKFEEIFANEYETIYIQEVEETFESYSEKYVLDNKIVIEKSWGAWNRLGNKISNTGIDVNIYFKESEKEENKKGFTIFSKSEYQANIEKLEQIIKEELENETDI